MVKEEIAMFSWAIFVYHIIIPRSLSETSSYVTSLVREDFIKTVNTIHE